ncbi:MAG: response regulator [Chromatiaceae bacterium]|nr:response regulator [Gammaproteobacteria bacterium]MCP5447370.1 response regulator [Chromatiaceae bacterium]
MKSILILDDEPAVRQSFMDYFEDRLWSAVQAGSGEAALALLEQEQQMAAIVDVRLPGMDGNDFIRSASLHYPAMGFVVCTGSPEYHLPPDLQDLANVSNRIFKKPIHDLMELECEVLRLVEISEVE